jgi:gephyrin
VALNVVMERVSTAIVGRIVAHDVYAALNVPNVRVSIVDGYAVRAGNGPGEYTVVSSSIAGTTIGETHILGELEAARVTTGAPVPRGTTAVVMVEDTELVAKTTDGSEELVVRILKAVTDCENIREIGSDIAQGQLVLRASTPITAFGAELGILISAGITSVCLCCKSSHIAGSLFSPPSGRIDVDGK